MGPRGSAVLAAALSLAPVPGRAAPAADPRREYELGIAERDAGNFAAAADRFDVAYRTLPAAESEVRAAVLFDLVDARRNAFAEGEGPPQICEAERLLAAYLEEVKRAFGAKGERRPDTRKAKKLLATVKQEIAALRREVKDLDCAREVIEVPTPAPDPTSAPDPAPPTDPTPQPGEKDTSARAGARRLIVAGAATTGAGGLFLIMMAAGLGVGAAAEREGAARASAALAAGTPLSESDPGLQALVRRGHVGNGLAIAGGVIGGAALVAGAVMLGIGAKRGGARRGGAARAGLAPGPGLVGGGLVLRF